MDRSILFDLQENGRDIDRQSLHLIDIVWISITMSISRHFRSGCLERLSVVTGES